MNGIKTLVWIMVLWCGIGGSFASLHAYQTDIFFLGNDKEYNKGAFKSTVLKNNTFIALVPECEKIAEVNELTLWDVEYVNNRLIVASGHKGKVYVLNKSNGKIIHSITLANIGANNKGKLDKDKSSYRRAAQALEAISIVKTDKNVVFVAAGPGCVADNPKAFIYTLSSSYKSAKLFATVPAEFIWSMTYNNGMLYVATGNEGSIYQVNVKTGEVVKFFTTKEVNVLKVKVVDNYLYASTDGAGYFYRIHLKTKAFNILYDARKRDINDFVAHNGTIFLGTAGRVYQPVKGSSASGAFNGSFTSTSQGGGQSIKKLDNNATRGYANNNHKVYYNEIIMIDANGKARTIYVLKNQLVTAMLLDERSSVLYFAASHSNENAIYSYNLNTFAVEKIYNTKEHSVSSFTTSLEGEIYFTSATGKALYRLSANYPEVGFYYTDVLDGLETVNWGRVVYSTYHLYEGKNDPYVKVMGRTGNTYFPDDGWTDWQAIANDGFVANQPSRFIQLRFDLKKISSQQTPAISDIKLYYGRHPRLPVIKNIELSKNYRFAKQKNITLQKKEEILQWQVTAFNNYALTYNVYYSKGFFTPTKKKRKGNWRLLRDNLTANFLVLNINNFSDGNYQFKIVIKNNMITNDGTKPVTQKIKENTYHSKKYVFDNTSPVVSFEKQSSRTIKVMATDTSRIASCRYSIDEKNYYNLTPSDGIFDNTQESFFIDMPKDYEGKILTLHIIDEYNNSTYKNIDF